MASIPLIAGILRRIYNEKDDRYKKKLFHEMMTNPGSRLAVLKRYANLTKDPNPVSSTMSIISTLYPFLMNVKGLSELNDDEKEKFVYLRKGNFEQKDTFVRDSRYDNQVRVRKELFNHWILKKMKEDEVPEESEVSKLLYKPLKKEVENYYSINYDKRFIKFKLNIQDSTRVNLRPQSMFNSYEAYDSVLTKMLEPSEITPKQEMDYMLVYERLKTENMLELFKSLGIIEQAKIIETLTSPLYRTVPTFRDLPHQMVNVGISFEGPNWSINTDFQLERFMRDDEAAETSLHTIIKETCDTFFNIIVNARFNDNIQEIRRLFRTLLIEKKGPLMENIAYIPLHTFITQETPESNEKIQFVKLLMGHPITLKTIIGKTNIFIVKGNPKTKRTVVNNYIVRDGRYSFGFIRDSLRGYVKIRDGYISDMLFNWTTLSEYMNLIEDLAEYLGVGAEVLDQEKRTHESMVRGIRENIRSRPSLLFKNTSDEHFKQMVTILKRDSEKTTDINFNIPKANYSSSVDVQSPNPAIYDFEVEKYEVKIMNPRIMDKDSKETINIIVNKDRIIGNFSPQVNSIEVELFQYLDWKIGLRKSIIELIKNVSYYLNFKTIHTAKKFQRIGMQCKYQSIRNTCKFIAEQMRRYALGIKRMRRKEPEPGSSKDPENVEVPMPEEFHPMTWAICTIFSSTEKTNGMSRVFDSIPVGEETIFIKYNQGLITHEDRVALGKRSHESNELNKFYYNGEKIDWNENDILIQSHSDSSLMMQVIDPVLKVPGIQTLTNLNEVRTRLGTYLDREVYYDDSNRLYRCYYDHSRSNRQANTVKRVLDGSMLRESTLGISS